MCLKKLNKKNNLPYNKNILVLHVVQTVALVQATQLAMQARHPPAPSFKQI